MESKKYQYINCSISITAVIDKLKETTCCTTRAEVVRRAVVLLDRVVTARKEGYDIILRKGDSEEKLMLL